MTENGHTRGGSAQRNKAPRSEYSTSVIEITYLRGRRLNLSCQRLLTWLVQQTTIAGMVVLRLIWLAPALA